VVIERWMRYHVGLTNAAAAGMEAVCFETVLEQIMPISRINIKSAHSVDSLARCHIFHIYHASLAAEAFNTSYVNLPPKSRTCSDIDKHTILHIYTTAPVSSDQMSLKPPGTSV
jgi:hypothetical protein